VAADATFPACEATHTENNKNKKHESLKTKTVFQKDKLENLLV
jgi:hypothetical protein